MKSNATIYLPDSSLIGSKFFEQFEEIINFKGLSTDAAATGMLLDLDFGSIECHFMSGRELQEHLRGLIGYVAHEFKGNEDDLKYIYTRIDAVTLAIGMNIEPSFEEEIKLWEFVLKLNNRLNSLIFLYDSLIDYDGVPLVGPLFQKEKN